MRTVILTKWVDLILQALATILSFALTHDLWEGMMAFYLSVGTIQATSCVLNRILLPRHSRALMRGVYEVTLLLLSLTILVFWISEYSDGMGACLMFLVYGSPVMAFTYFIITIVELTAAHKVINVPEETPIQEMGRATNETEETTETIQ